MKNVIIAAAAVLLLAGTASAQEGSDYVSGRAANGIMLEVFSNGGGIAYWRKLSERGSIGIEGSGSWDDIGSHEGSGSSSYVAATVAGKYYLPALHNVAPYLYGGLMGSYRKYKREDEGEYVIGRYEDATYTYAARAAVGFEWFPVQNISVGGHVGITGGFNRADNKAGYDDEMYKQRQDGAFVSTFNSGIRMHFYY